MGKKHTFGLLFKENAYRIRLKDGVLNSAYQQLTRSNQLDVSVAHKFIIEAGLNIALRDQHRSEIIDYDRNFSDCYAKVLTEKAKMGIILNEIDIQTVKDICYSGNTLPQKTTYFYPKVISGFLFGSISEDEFKFPFDLSF